MGFFKGACVSRTVLSLGLALLVSCVSSKKSDEGVNKPFGEDDQKVHRDPGDLHVLSYNICWECMSNNADGTIPNGSAAKLGAACVREGVESKLTVCGRNVVNTIEDVEKQTPLDLVGIQEASHWRELQEESFLKNLSHVDFKSADEEIVLFYNPKKLSLIRAMGGDTEPGRPFQIVLFKGNLVVVNLHMGHHQKSSDSLTKKLSAVLKEHLTEKELRDLRKDRIIMMGDFNDHTIPPLFRKFRPFSHAGISTEVSLLHPDISCCDTKITTQKWNGKKPGDYILDSEKMISFGVPSTYDRSIIASDHLPVVATLESLWVEL